MKPKNTRVCQRCKVKDTSVDDMDFELVGIKKPIKKFYHKECFKEHSVEKEFKKKEREELDKLNDIIKEIYNIKQVPNQIFPFLQDLRNGTKFFGKHDYKYKSGYSYELIGETFIFCEETIKYWNGRKKFNGTTGAIRYGLAIVCDKIQIVEKKKQVKEKNESILKSRIDEESVKQGEFVSNYRQPTKAKNDISDFLD